MGQTGTIEVVVRSAARADLSAVSHTLARAFEDDPVFAYLLPKNASRRRRLRICFGALLRRDGLPPGAVDIALVNGRIAGAAIWRPPDRLQLGSIQLAAVPGYLACFQREFRRAGRFAGVCVREHPRAERHWYLQFIGTEPALHGQGVGAALLRSRLARLDEEGSAAYLESSNPANMPIYEHFGYEATGLLDLPQDAPPVMRMWRPAARPESVGSGLKSE